MTDHIPEVDGRRRRRGSDPKERAERPGEAKPTPPSQPEPRPQTDFVGEVFDQAPPQGQSSYQSPQQGQSGSPQSSDGLGGALGGLGGLLGGLASGSGGSSSPNQSPFGGTASGGVPGQAAPRRGCGSIIFLIILMIVLFFLWRSCSKGIGGLPGTDLNQPPISEAQPTLPLPIATNALEQAPQVPQTQATQPAINIDNLGKKAKWLVMAYIDADDKALERDLMFDLNEMELIGSTEDVVIVAQVDRYDGGYSGDGNWSTTRRYLVLQDDDLNVTGSQLIQDLGELNMGEGQTLVDFVTWAANQFPAERHMLLMSDHGMGWPGGWSDPKPAMRNRTNAPLGSAMQDAIILLDEFEAALKQIQQSTVIDKFDLIGLDVCLMSQMEVYSALAPYAHYVVASEETEPGVGWAYEAFLSKMVYDPETSTADIAKNIVETYLTADQRIVDEQARAEFLSQNSSGGGWYVNRMSAAQLGAQLEQNSTLAAIDLQHFPELLNAFNDFTFKLQSVDQRAVAQARSYTQSYTSIFGSNVPASYIDMGHFAALTAKISGDQNIYQAANTLLQTLQKVVIAEKHGPGKPGSTGIALYFPNSQLYQNGNTGMASYTVIANTFARQSVWDDFLAYHYSGRQFQAQAAEPVMISRASQIPGGGAISVSEINASAERVAAGDEIDLDVTITGENVAHVYFFTGIVANNGHIYVADTDFVESGQKQELNGVYYPVWPQTGAFKLNFTFEPILYTISDGSQDVMALFNPVDFGKDYKNAVYAVHGTYTFKETGEKRAAQLLFKDEKLFQVMGFVGLQEGGAASEITPNIGDSFTVKEQWMTTNAQGQVTGSELREGETLTFSGQPIVAVTKYLPKGKAVIGFMVSDFDGQVRSVFKEIAID